MTRIARIDTNYGRDIFNRETHEICERRKGDFDAKCANEHEFRAGFAGRRNCVVNIKNPLFFFRPGFSLPLRRMDKERTKT